MTRLLFLILLIGSLAASVTSSRISTEALSDEVHEPAFGFSASASAQQSGARSGGVVEQQATAPEYGITSEIGLHCLDAPPSASLHDCEGTFANTTYSTDYGFGIEVWMAGDVGDYWQFHFNRPNGTLDHTVHWKVVGPGSEGNPFQSFAAFKVWSSSGGGTTFYQCFETTNCFGVSWALQRTSGSSLTGAWSVKIQYLKPPRYRSRDTVTLLDWPFYYVDLQRSVGYQAASAFGGDPVNLSSGNFLHEHTDLSISSVPVPLAFARSYNSLRDTAGPMGRGWTHSWEWRLIPSSSGPVELQMPDGSNTWFARNPDGSFDRPPGGGGSLTKNADGSYEFKTRDQLRLRFSAAGRLEYIEDRNTNRTSVAYSGTSELTSITDTRGRALTITWAGFQGNRRIVSIADPLGRSVLYNYDASGSSLISVRDVGGGLTTFEYDAGRLSSMTDSLGNVVNQNFYDASNRVVRQLDGELNETLFAYDTVNRRTTVTYPRLNTRTYTFDTLGRLVQETHALGARRFTYPDQSATRYSLFSQEDELGHRTTFTHDLEGNLKQVTDHLGKSWKYTYDALNNVDKVTDPLNRVTDYNYDSRGNLVSVTNAKLETITFTRNADGTVQSTTDPLQHATSLEYDSFGHPSLTRDALGHETLLDYDGGGRLLKVTDPLLHETTYTYTARNDVETITDALGNLTSYTYDAKGQLRTTTDADQRVTEQRYDANGRVEKVIDYLLQEVTYHYDGHGNRDRVTNQRGKITTYTYDALDRLTTIIDPIGRTTTYGYDAAGRRTSRLDGNGSLTTYGFDVLDRLTMIDYPAGTSDVAFTYDALGNRLTMVDGTGTTTFTLDPLYRPTSITQGANTVGYGYDAAGRPTTLTYPGGGSVTYGYDDANRLTAVTDWLGNVTTYAYDDANRLATTVLGNGLTSDRGYDDANRLLSVVNRNGTATISSYAYTVDNLGKRQQLTSGAGTEAYTYDDLDRLTGVTYANGDVQAYTYDPMGNRLTKSHNGVPTAFSYDDADQMTFAGSVAYAYDDNGNQASAGADTFTWDAENRLVTSTTGGTAATYAYNGDGLRTSRTVGGNGVSYIWALNAALPVILQDTDGNRYVYGLDLLTRINGTTEEWNLYDGLGSTTDLADAAGAVTGSYQYDVFGAVRAQTGATTEWSYTGEQNDPTGLEYLRARYYDGASGRFLSQDPILATHPYAYVDNNASNMVDASGLEPNEPEPAPLPIVGSEERHDICLAGFIDCIDRIAPAEQERRRNDPNPFLRTITPYNNVCADVQRRCLNASVPAGGRPYFDQELARQKMQDMFSTLKQQADWNLSDLLPPIPDFSRVRLPLSGSGGLLGSGGLPGKEGVSCWVAWARIW